MESQKSHKEKSMLLALLLFLGAAGLIFAYLSSSDVGSRGGVPAAAKTDNFEKSVNKHLMITNENIELQKQRMKIENARLMNSDFSSTKAQSVYQNDDRLDLSQDTRGQDLANEMGRGEKREEFASPHDIVQKELFNEQQMQEYTQAYKEEYARQFVENARRGGYKVILSEDLSRVISVTPLKKPNQNSIDLFGSGSEALQ